MSHATYAKERARPTEYRNLDDAFEVLELLVLHDRT